MPTKPNPIIGRVQCPFTGARADVRKDRHARLYFNSPAGRIFPTGGPGQDWMLEHAEIWGEGGSPPVDTPPAPAPAPEPAPKPAPPPAPAPKPSPAPVIPPRRSFTLLG